MLDTNSNTRSKSRTNHDPAHPQNQPPPPLHPLESLVAALLDPPPADIDSRAQEYDLYTHYHADLDYIPSEALGEEKDLQVYLRAARLASGDVEVLDALETTSMTREKERDKEKDKDKDEEGREEAKVNFYEHWLKG